jgi:gliding motility-associated-like protein
MRKLSLIYRPLTAICLFLVFHSSTHAQLKASFSTSTTEGCAPVVTRFKDESTGNPGSWKWDLGNGTVSFLQNPAATYFNPGTYTIKLIVRNGAQADSVVKVNYIRVYAAPAVNFSVSDTAGCFPLNVQFKDLSDAGDGTVTGWEWDFGDGATSTEQHPEHRYTAAGDFTVALRVYNSHGCSQTITRKQFITLHNGVKADFSFAVPNSCKPPTPVQFTNSSTGTGTLGYEWDFGDGNTSTDANPIHTYTVIGTYSVKLWVRNQTGCTDLIEKTNIIHIGTVKADFAIPALTCNNQPLSLANNTTPAPVGAYWTFGDGSNSTAISPVKTYTQPGNYTIKLVSDFGACKDSVSKTIQVLATTKAGFTADDSTSCKAPFAVQFTPTATGHSYEWWFGDGSKSTEASPSHTYTANGEYKVTLIVTNAAGCTDTLAKKKYIQIKAPEVELLQLPQEGCVPYNWQPILSVKSVDELAGYVWHFGDGTTSTDKTPQHTYAQAGTYTVKLVYTTAGGCTDSIIVKDAIRVGNHPNVAFNATPRDACAFQPIGFKDGSTGAVADKWLWNFGDGGTATSQDPQHIYQDTGYFNVKLVVWSNGCRDSVTTPRFVHIKPPIARFDVAPVNCTIKFSRQFNDLSIGATEWQWDFGDGASSTQRNPVHVFNRAGSYIVKLTVRNETCEHTTSKQVLILSEKADFTTSDNIACKNTPVTLTAVNSNAQYISGYAWQITKDNVVIATPAGPSVQFSFPAAGQYGIRLVITDLYGCTDTLDKPFSIKVNGPTADFSVLNPEVCTNTTIRFADSSKTDGEHPIQQWTWNYGDGATETLSGAPFQHLYTQSGVYPVQLTVKDNAGCTDTRLLQHAVTISRPVVQFVSPDTLSCTTQAIRFVNQTTGNNPVYTWYFGDGQTTAAEQPAHSYSSIGDYTIKLVASDRYGCADSLTKQLYIHIEDPKAQYKLSDSFATCPPLLVNFTNQSRYYTRYEWNFGDGSTSTLENPSHLYTYPGVYKAKLTITSPGGCTDTFVKTITVKGPQGTFTYDKVSGCVPTEIAFTGHANQNIRFIWDYNDGTVDESEDKLASHLYTAMGAYLPKMIIEDPQGCRVPVIGKDTIHIYGVNADFAADKTLLCDSGLVNFLNNTVSNDLITGYQWTFGDGQTATAKQPAHFYQQSGQYATRLIVTTQNGCKDTAKLSLPLKIVQGPQAAIQSDSGACAPALLTFRGSLLKQDTSAVQWRWDFGNGATSTEQVPQAVNFVSAGEYRPRLIVVNSSGCADTVYQTVHSWPLPVVDAGADQVICRNSNITLTGQGAAQYTWFPANNLSCTSCAAPLASPLEDRTYSVTGKNIYGCSATDSIRIVVKQPFTLQTGKGDTLCRGESFQLLASGAEEYHWSPSLWMDNSTSDKPKVKPDTSVVYRVIGSDRQHCFADTGYVPVVVYAYPIVQAGDDKTIPVGNSATFEPVLSADITGLRWLPAVGLSCVTCPKPTVSPKQSVSYTLEAWNKGGCVSRDQISVSVFCNNANVFVPNTFSPNGDGNNDVFYPRGKGVYMIQNFRIFNRWGDVVYEQLNIQPNEMAKGWTGLHKGKPAPSDVYIYSMDVVCENNVMLNYKGNVALIR